MIKRNLVQYRFCIRKLIPVIVIASVILTSSFFITETKNIFAGSDSKNLICIDPGHGGRDTGAIGPSGLREKDVNLDIAARLRDKLRDAGFKVILTREDDTKKSLDEIVNFANTNNADIFVSVHNNSHTNREKCGTETFFFSQSAGGNVLAGDINSKTIEQIGTFNRGVKTANFFQLRNTKMTSALVEGAFISNPDEEAKLNDSNFRDKIAIGIYNGILLYLNIDANNVSSAKRLASAQSFVKRVYQKSLNIDPDSTTLNNWADKLVAGTISHADMIREIILSKQFKDRNLTNTQYITVLYKAVLDRDPDSNGAAQWLNQLKVLDRTAVLNYFLSSAEFASLVNQYIQSGYNYTGTIDGNAAKTNSAQTTTAEAGNALILSFLNGVGIKGIAAKTAGLFKEFKDSDGKNRYGIYMVIDADNYNYQNTKIICKSNEQEIVKAAEEIKTILKAGIITTQKGTAQVSDIVIIIGKDFSLSSAGTSAANAASDASDKILVNILNGKGAPGIAAKAKSKIETVLNKDKNIIKVTETKNADSFNYTNTKIIIFTKKSGINNIAEDLKKFLGTGEIKESSNNVDNVDITIILGSDYKQ